MSYSTIKFGLLLIAVFCFLVNCELPPSSFSYGDFFPRKSAKDARVSESQTSGPIRDVIKRNSPRFRKVLVRNSDPNILFGTDDLRLMTSRAKQKLDTLAGLVSSRFSKDVKIKVLKAWTDVVDKNDILSLHYEGRAFLIQASNNNKDLLDDLMLLAIEAGFDWVYYKNMDSIYLSVIPDVCQTKLDLSIIVDTSGSVGFKNFDRVKIFLMNLIEFFNVGLDETRIALVSYSHYVIVEFRLNENQNKQMMKDAISKILYQRSITATGDALMTLVKDIYSEKNGMRVDKSIPKIGILMTDGYSNGDYNVHLAAEQVKQAGINMFVVGVTGSVQMSEVKSIATPPWEQHYFAINSFTDLSSFVDQISAVSCDEGAQLSQCENAETAVDGGSFKYFQSKFTGSTQRVSVEVLDKKGTSFVFTSTKLRNPGPLSEAKDVKKSDSKTSPRTIMIDLPLNVETILYIAIQGQEDNNVFDLSIWESLFPDDQITKVILENEDAGLLVATVQTKTNPKSFNYKIKDGLYKEHFQINMTNGKITTTQSLDRESISSYQLSVIAEDQKDECHKGLMSIVIYVGDKNDNMPIFEKSNYSVQLREDTPLNQYVIQVRATDKDVGKNAELAYEIYGENQDFFKIEKETGIIKTNNTLDYETRSTYIVNLKVRDFGSNVNFGFATLMVVVTDVNEPPEFMNCKVSRSCIFKIDENQPENTTVGNSLSAKDPDTKQLCTLSYNIISLDKQYFRIFNNVIKTRMPLDRETKESYLLEVAVSDCGKPPLLAYATIVVILNDLNDNSPKFFDSSYQCFAKEDLSPKSPLCAVRATDIDAGNNAQIIFSIFSSDDEGIASINSTTGQLTLQKKLDRETKANIKLVINATDQGKPSLNSSVDLTIVVIDVNDNAPTFAGKMNLSINENVVIGTFVTKLQADDKDEGLNAQFRFSIVSGNIDNMFGINNKGELFTQKIPDREEQELYALKLMVQDLGVPSLSNEATYTIKINDLNDNSPVFEKPRYNLTVKENKIINSLVTKVTATDKDIGINKELIYQIVGGNQQNTFSLDKDFGNLTLVSALNFGIQRNYILNIVATDKGSPSRKGEAFIDITVEDTNDFTPTFVGQPYQKGLDENVIVGTTVLLINATDDDFGPSGELTYSIKSLENMPFIINPQTGLITTKSQIDYEVNQSFFFMVYVKDAGTPSLQANTSVNVSIIDVNDNAPFMVNQIIFVIENEVVNKTIFNLNGIDKDSGSNSLIDYSLISSSVPFKIQQEQLKVSGVLDRETVDKYILIVQLKDRGKPQQTSLSTITVIVNDINDNDPKFGKSVYNCSVRENSHFGSRVCFVDATDADTGENAKLSFFLTNSSTFLIDKISGEIKTNASLDREVRDNYLATIIVKDNGVNPRESKALLDVRILDENDNPPKFKMNSYNFNFQEEQVDGTIVGSIFATDEDIGSNKEIVYNVMDTNRFWVENQVNQGILKAKRLNREEKDLYKFRIKATDKGTPSLSSEVNVIVAVTDINDNKPLIETKKYHRSIKETVANGTFVVKISASDLDIGNNSVFSYRIKSSINSDHFYIDPMTGVITTAANLDYETITSYLLNIETKDEGSPPLSDETIVNITIINEDDTAPKFEQVKNVSIYEDLGVNQPVLQFKATDADGSEIRYKIEGGNTDNTFVINSATGLLSLKNNLDRERIDFYNISVNASDTNKHNVIYLPVIVLDVNDNYPQFNQVSYNGTVVEESNDFAKVIVSVNATDRDLKENGEIEYSIVSDNKDVFGIDLNSGIIHSKKKLDREVVDSYRVEVAASDKGTPSLYSIVYVTINVEDINDNSPKFENAAYNIYIDENSGADITIAQLTAHDADKGENGRVTYKITKDVTKSFAINDTSGSLSAVVDLDKEKEDLYLVEITASDHGDSAKSSIAKVSILVLDVNDNAPVIQTKIFPAINESVSVGTKLNVILASDADKDDINKNLVFSITPDIFRIESNGDVFLNRPLDRELVSEYTAIVRVEDTGLPRLYTSMQYTVNVTDDNDNAPEFLSPYSAQLEENASSQKLFTVQAKDIDIGINSKVAYGIIDNYKGIFLIYPVSGDLYAIKPVDYETDKSFTLNITASDWKFTTFITAKIDVINLNDNFPQFKKTEYSSAIFENATKNSFVLEVSAIDLDPFGELSYSIKTTGGIPFTIESKTGRIKVSDILDREKVDKYSFKVTVFDGGNPKLSNETNVLITILDVNDNSPKFATYSEVISVKENQPVGTLISKTKASDDDLGQNALVRYEAVLNSLDLNIDIVTGEIKTSRIFDREVIKSSITFTYVAYDLGDPKLISEKRTITLDIEDENDNSPMWLNNYSVSVLEDYATNSQIFFVEAVDIDLGENAVVTYYIEENSTFQIDHSSGAISLKTSLDRETKGAYNLTVFARDNGSVFLESSTTVSITVLDVNDNKPLFNEKNLHAQILENTKGENDLVLIQSTDQDIGSNAEIVYSLHHDLFSIHPITGQVKVLRSLDREETDKYNITVVARDKGNPSLSTEAVLIVDVLDVDDNCPVFASSFYKETISENLPFGTSILKVSATDSDFGENARLNYGIMESNDRGAFTIDAYSGWITVAKSDKVDREFSEVYHLLVKAGSTSCGFSSGDTDIGDGGKPVENNFTLSNVYITITDLNDNAPVILNDYQKIDFENVTVDEIVIVKANDKDLGKGGEVEFRIIRVDQKIVSNRVENHVFIEVSDKGDTPLATNATFIVVNQIKCDVMYFSIDEVGLLTVNSLCSVHNLNSNEPVLVGSPVNLSCIATGNSLVIYRWSKDGSVISGWSEDGNLLLSAVKHDSEGLYACIASNKAGVLQSSTTKLIVHEKPSIVKQPTSVTVSEKEHAVFKVQASAVPAPKYQWYKNDLPIKGATKEDFMLELTIPADSAKYFCKITNEVGEVQSEKVYLTVVNRESVVALTVKMLTVNKKNVCFDFFTEDFEEQAKIVLNRPVIVTNIQNVDDKAKLCNRTACSKNPCQNKGVCEVTDTGFQCICTSSWKGKICEENINECVQDSFVCYNGVCSDLTGSFSCVCPTKMSGHRCQYNATACQNNICQSGICVPSENNLFNCINKSDVITLIAKPIANWTLQTQYDLELSLNRIIKTTVTSVSTNSNRIRKDTLIVDFGLCTVHVTDHVLENGESKISFALDCSVGQLKRPIDFSSNVVKELCLQLLNSDEVFSQCGQLGYMQKSKVPTVAPLNAFVYVVIKDDRNKTISADETIKIMKDKNFASLLESYNYRVTNFRNAYERQTAVTKNSYTSVIIVAASCGVVLLAIVLLFVFRRHSQTQGKDKQTSIMHQRSMMTHDTSTSNLLPSSTCKKNMAFNDENDDVKDGTTFMFEVPSGLISGKK